MTRRLVIECGAAETRATRLIEEEIVEFRFGPALGDEALPRPPEFGDICAGRVLKSAPALRGAFVDIGASRDAFLTLGEGAKAPVEGARIVVKVRRPPLGRKGALVDLDWRVGLAAEEQAAVEKRAADAPGVLNEAHAAVRAFRAFAGMRFDRIETNSPEAAAALRPAGAIVHDDLDLVADIDEALERTLERSIGLDGGARMIFDETEGGAFIDVDGGAAAAEAGSDAANGINAEAASVLFQELQRRAIGGRVIVDFLPLPNRRAREAFLQALRHGPKDGYECRLGELSADGLLDLTAPRRRRSLLEEATEEDATRPRPGRRFTLDWNAKAAIRKLETSLKRQPNGRPRLLVGGEIADYLASKRPQWTERLAQRYGARFAIQAQEKLEERAYDLAE